MYRQLEYVSNPFARLQQMAAGAMARYAARDGAYPKLRRVSGLDRLFEEGPWMFLP